MDNLDSSINSDCATGFVSSTEDVADVSVLFVQPDNSKIPASAAATGENAIRVVVFISVITVVVGRAKFIIIWLCF